eukprot:249857-Alexandrium_andersonii.AAC.1
MCSLGLSADRLQALLSRLHSLRPAMLVAGCAASKAAVQIGGGEWGSDVQVHSPLPAPPTGAGP